MSSLCTVSMNCHGCEKTKGPPSRPAHPLVRLGTWTSARMNLGPWGPVGGSSSHKLGSSRSPWRLPSSEAKGIQSARTVWKPTCDDYSRKTQKWWCKQHGATWYNHCVSCRNHQWQPWIYKPHNSGTQISEFASCSVEPGSTGTALLGSWLPRPKSLDRLSSANRIAWTSWWRDCHLHRKIVSCISTSLTSHICHLHI